MSFFKKKETLKENTENDRQSKQKKSSNSIAIPKITPDIMKMFFLECDKKQDSGILKIEEDRYSVCFEYSDISFSKENTEMIISIFLKYADFLNSFSKEDHIQIIHAGIPVKTELFKENYVYQIREGMNEEQKTIVKEFNTLIENFLGHKEETAKETRLVVVSTKASSFDEAEDIFLQYQLKIEDKFKILKSKVRRWNVYERLEMLYNTFHINSLKKDFPDITDLLAYAESQGITIYDFLAPKEDVNLREKNYLTIEGDNEQKKFIQMLYVSKFPTSLTPKFYNDITTIEDANIIITENITPKDTGKAIKNIDKKISGMKTERLSKIKRAVKSGYSYEAVKDQKLEEKIKDTEQLRIAITKKKQKLFSKNIILCVTANSLKEMKLITQRIKDIANEYLLSIDTLDWQQLEGLQNILPFGYNTLQFQRTLTSEATATSVPFNTKELMMPNSIYYGMDLISKKMVFADRKALINGNGCVLATSGSGKSFLVKLTIEQLMLRYPEDEIFIIDPMAEYNPVVKVYNGQTIKLATTAKTYINPFDSALDYSSEMLDEEDPIKLKTEYILAFIESIIDKNLTGEQKSIIDRCTKNVFMKKETDPDFVPDFPSFYEELLTFEEIEAKGLALVLERYIKGSMDLFSNHTNIELNNRLVCFDTSELTTSLKTTGYLVILEYIMNRLKINRDSHRSTWIFMDEFHVLLSNTYAANYTANFYKMGRKLGAFPTFISQQIEPVLDNEKGREILSNSDFAIIMKLKQVELKAICKIFNISDEESSYLVDPHIGEGLLVFDKDVIPFKNTVPDNYLLFKLNQTDHLQKSRL